MSNQTPPFTSQAPGGRVAVVADAERQPIVEARGVEKYYEQEDGHRIQIIAPLDLTIEKGEIVTLLGPSGSGKSTLLRILSGLAQPSSGTVLWHGKPLEGTVPNVGIVFQNFALFPWLTVLENVEAPLEARGAGPVERHKRALRMLDIVGLDGYETAYPKELSGGMKQRVGFARSLVIEPAVLFMDEPFSSLDVLTAENLRGELLELWLDKKMPTTTIFMVTHNIEEAVLLADRIIVLSSTPAHVLARFRVDLPRPRERGAPDFIELVDLIYGVLTRPTADVAARAAGEKAAPAAGPVPDRIVRLPHARPGGILGLLEILVDRDGRDDLYKLAGALVMEVDDLLPIVEGAALMGFMHVREGDAEITDEGRAFVGADIQTRKTLFRAAALRHVPLLRQMSTALKAKADGALPDEFFRDILDEHFTAEDSQRQLETAINWGRYSEIFDYDAQTGRLFRTET